MDNDQKIVIHDRPLAVLKKLSHFNQRESLLVYDGSCKQVLKRFPDSAATEFVARSNQWKNARRALESGLVAYSERGVHEGRPFALRPWIEGIPFDEYARQVEFDPHQPDAAIHVALVACHTVVRLHRTGFIHGHLVSGNILFDESNQMVLCDPLLGPLPGGEVESDDLPRLAPEQSDPSLNPDKRTDVWYLGELLCLLLLRGVETSRDEERLQQLTQQGLPSELIDIVWQATEDDPANRFADAGQLATALNEYTWLDCKKTIDVRPAPIAEGIETQSNSLTRNLVVCLLALGIIGASIWYSNRESEPESEFEVASVVQPPAEKPALEERPKFIRAQIAELEPEETLPEDPIELLLQQAHEEKLREVKLLTQHASRFAPHPLPLQYLPNGVRFLIQAPGAKQVYIAGTFNGWGGSDGSTMSNPGCKMFGPDNHGVFEMFLPLTNGDYIFKYAIDGHIWFPGPENLALESDDFDRAEGQGGLMGSKFSFKLREEPWPSYVPTKEMLPVVFDHNETGDPYLRVRFFSRRAKIAHVVGSWDGWAGIGSWSVSAPDHAMKLTQVPNIWETYIGPLHEGTLEYKIVANYREWYSDPGVRELTEEGATLVTINRKDGQWYPKYTPRFDPNATRPLTEYRWSGLVKWEDDRNAAFAKARLTQKPMLWVITMEASPLSVNLMKLLNADTAITNMGEKIIFVETPAHEVRDILQKRGIARVPYVVIVNEQYKPVFEKYNPSVDEIKAELRNILNNQLAAGE